MPNFAIIRAHVNSTGRIKNAISAFSAREALKNLKRMFWRGIVKIANAMNAIGRIIIKPIMSIGKICLIFKKIKDIISSVLKIKSNERSKDEKIKRFAKQIITKSHA